jgi:hypothetical protein
MTYDGIKTYLTEHTSIDPDRIKEGDDGEDTPTAVVEFHPVLIGIGDGDDGLRMEVAFANEDDEAVTYPELPITPEGEFAADGLSLPELALKVQRVPREMRRQCSLELQPTDSDRRETVMWPATNRRVTFAGGLPFPNNAPGPGAGPIREFRRENRRVILLKEELEWGEVIYVITKRLDKGQVVQTVEATTRGTAKSLQAALTRFLYDY